MSSAAGMLLVEDDPALSSTLERYFTARGYRVHVAESEEAAEASSRRTATSRRDP